MFYNWGAVLGSQYFWGVSSSADTTGEALGIFPWLVMRNDWMSQEEKKIVLLMEQ